MKKILFGLSGVLLFISCSSDNDSNNKVDKKVNDISYESYKYLSSSLINNTIKNLDELENYTSKKQILDYSNENIKYIFSDEKIKNDFGIKENYVSKNNTEVLSYNTNSIDDYKIYFDDKKLEKIKDIFSVEEQEYLRKLIISLVNEDDDKIIELIDDFKKDIKSNKNLSNIYFTFSTLESMDIFNKNKSYKNLNSLEYTVRGSKTPCFDKGMRRGAISGTVSGIGTAIIAGATGSIAGPLGAGTGVLGGYLSGASKGFVFGFISGYLECKAEEKKPMEAFISEDISLEKLLLDERVLETLNFK